MYSFRRSQGTKLVFRVIICGIDSWFPIEMVTGNQGKQTSLWLEQDVNRESSPGWTETVFGRATCCFWEQDMQSKRREGKWGEARLTQGQRLCVSQRGGLLVSRAGGICPASTVCGCPSVSLKDLTSSWGVQGRKLIPWAQSLPFCSLRVLWTGPLSSRYVLRVDERAEFPK